MSKLRKTAALVCTALALLLRVPAEARQDNAWSPTTGTVSGLQLTQNYNNAFSAILSCNSGGSAPVNDQTGVSVAGQCWLNTGTTPNTVQKFDGAQWTTIGWLDSTNHQWVPNVAGSANTVASASTTDLCNTSGTLSPSINVTVSGTVTINSFGSNCLTGQMKLVTFSGALTLTHNASSLILPSNGSNITTAAGDTLIATSLGSGNWRIVSYTKASGAVIDSSSWTNYTLGPSCGTATFSTLVSRTKTWGKVTFIAFDFTFTAIGTCTTGLTINLPNTVAATSINIASDAVNTETTVNCRVSGGGVTTLPCVKSAAANFVNGDHIVGSGSYENQ